VHVKDSHDYMLTIALHELSPIPQAWYFKIDELTCADFYPCDFERCDPLVLVLYGDVIIFVGCLE
jgi:hypothetical protein